MKNIVFTCLGEGYLEEMGYPGQRGIRGRGYPRESGIHGRALSGGEGYPGERGIRGRGVSEGEGYPGKRGRETSVRELKGEREEGCRKTRENVVHSEGRE